MGKCKIELIEDEELKPNTGSLRVAKYRSYKQRFRQEWLENVLFSGWLREVPEDPEKCRCLSCDRILSAKYTDLIKHASSKRHCINSPAVQFDIKVLYPNEGQNVLSDGSNSIRIVSKTEKKLSTKSSLGLKKIYTKKKRATALTRMNVGDYLKILRSLARIPTLKSAVICHSANEDVLVEACWTTRNLSSKSRITSENHYFFKNYNIVQVPPSIREPNIILKSFNAKGDKHAYVYQDDDKYHLGIVDGFGQIVTLNLKDINKHGKVYTNPELSSLVFSPDSSKLAFIAEKKRAKGTSFLDSRPVDNADGWGRKNEFLDNWGEQMETYHKSCLVIVDIESEEIVTLDFPDDLCGGDVIWTPCSTRLVGTAYITEPYRLGLIYCANRESVLFEIDLAGNFEEITARGMHAKSARFKPDGSSLVFFRCPAGGPHVMAAQLCKMDFETREVTVLVDYVQTEQQIDEQVFTGFTGASQLPYRCWSKDGEKIVVNGMDYFEKAVFLVDAESGVVSRLPFDSSFTAHDWVDGWLLLSASSFTSPSILYLWNDEWATKSFVQVSEQLQIEGVAEDWVAKYKCNKIGKVGNSDIPAIYLGPTEESTDKRPLIVWPHGGPHSMVPNAFSYQPLFFLRLGYSIIFPNYRGSLGQGKRGINSLPGHVGTHDVNDVHGAALDCMVRFGQVLDSSRVVLVGGSHGGFLVAHLSAQHPNYYKAVASRNPVIDISSMSGSSDIPDWSFVESGLSYKIGKNASLSDLESMRRLSPIDILDEVRAPTLFMLGKNDKRVPMDQGMLAHKVMKANNVPTSLFVYDDSHPLDKVEVETDTLIQTALWFDKYIR